MNETPIVAIPEPILVVLVRLLTFAGMLCLIVQSIEQQANSLPQDARQRTQQRACSRRCRRWVKGGTDREGVTRRRGGDCAAYRDRPT